jgi:hypothetical protein
MYINLQSGESTVAAVAAPTLQIGATRRNILAIVIGNDLFTPAEQLRCNHNVHECQDPTRLALWLRNVRREAMRREEVAEPQAELLDYATAEQKEEIVKLAGNVCVTRPERTRALLSINRYDYAQAVCLIGELWAKILRRSAGESACASHTSYAAPAPAPIPPVAPFPVRVPTMPPSPAAPKPAVTDSSLPA